MRAHESRGGGLFLVVLKGAKEPELKPPPEARVRKRLDSRSGEGPAGVRR